MAQLPQLTNVPVAVYILTLLSLAIIYILPLFTQAVPSPLVALAVMTIAAIALKLDVPTVGDMGELPTTLPVFAIPQVPLNLETLQIILPYSLTMAIVGLLASFLTAALVDDLTDTPSDKNQEAKGQGIANIVTAFFGGMAGCGMIGQSVINVQSGGRGRLSTLSAGVFLLFAILVLQDWVKDMPMAVLVAVMIMVSIGTFSWSSFITRNFALGVATGIVMSTVFFSRKIAQLVFVDKTLSDDGTQRIYKVAGQIFFLSKEEFLRSFNFTELVERVTIDLTQAHLWDQGAVETVDKVVSKFRRNGAEVEVVGLNEASATLFKRLADNKESAIIEN